MPLTINGVSPQKITYNGSDVKTVTYNGVTIWELRKEIQLSSAASGSTLTLYTASSGSASNGSITAGKVFFLISTTATNGRLPVIHNGGLYWVTSTYPKVRHSFTVYSNSMVVLYNGSGFKSIYADRSEKTELGKWDNTPFFEVYERTPVSGYYYGRYDSVTGYIIANTYLGDVIDLSNFDLTPWCK